MLHLIALHRPFSLSAICWLIVWGLLLTGSIVPAVQAQDLAAEPNPLSQSKSENTPLPEAFSKPVPTSISDLRDMQQRITELVPELSACTVNLRIGRAQGTGVIVSEDGLILSAAHVTGRPGQPVVIITVDGKQFEGVTLGRNSTLDGSMVRIKSSRQNWPHRPVSTDAGQPGEWCLTLGHPGGFQQDRGLVLRVGRVIEQNDWLIQTDCELIGGDSGGPLFNMRGEVIGINTRIGESTQYNFHVPASAFTRDWERMLASEDFKSHSGAYLGVGGIPAESGRGLLIQVVEPRTPAEREGLKAGDILLTFQGVDIQEINQLITLVGEESPGRSVKLTILREGVEIEISARLGMRWDR